MRNDGIMPFYYVMAQAQDNGILLTAVDKKEYWKKIIWLVVYPLILLLCAHMSIMVYCVAEGRIVIPLIMFISFALIETVTFIISFSEKDKGNDFWDDFMKMTYNKILEWDPFCKIEK